MRTSSGQDLTVKEQRWEFKDGQKVKVKGGDKSVPSSEEVGYVFGS